MLICPVSYLPCKTTSCCTSNYQHLVLIWLVTWMYILQTHYNDVQRTLETIRENEHYLTLLKSIKRTLINDRPLTFFSTYQYIYKCLKLTDALPLHQILLIEKLKELFKLLSIWRPKMYFSFFFQMVNESLNSILNCGLIHFGCFNKSFSLYDLPFVQLGYVNNVFWGTSFCPSFILYQSQMMLWSFKEKLTTMASHQWLAFYIWSCFSKNACVKAA